MRYDDPMRAMKVYWEYIDEKTPKDIQARAAELLRDARTVEDLDIALDGLITGHSAMHICGSRFGTWDISEEGENDNKIRALEQAG